MFVSGSYRDREMFGNYRCLSEDSSCSSDNTDETDDGGEGGTRR